MFLFLFFFILSQEIFSYKITFKKFINRKLLEMNYLGDKEVIDILNNIQKSAIQIKKILSLSFFTKYRIN